MREDMQTRTTRRRFMLTAPLGVSALSICTTGRVNQSGAAPRDSGNLAELTTTEGFLSFDRAIYRLSGTSRHFSISVGTIAPSTHSFGRTRSRYWRRLEPRTKYGPRDGWGHFTDCQSSSKQILVQQTRPPAPEHQRFETIAQPSMPQLQRN
jgi:hypothetical protein